MVERNWDARRSVVFQLKLSGVRSFFLDLGSFWLQLAKGLKGTDRRQTTKHVLYKFRGSLGRTAAGLRMSAMMLYGERRIGRTQRSAEGPASGEYVSSLESKWSRAEQSTSKGSE